MWRWYPQGSPKPVRPKSARPWRGSWPDRAYPPFHEALLKLLHDPEPMVRRNAAPGLVAFGTWRRAVNWSPCCTPTKYTPGRWCGSLPAKIG
jgi:hypothetical protein